MTFRRVQLSDAALEMVALRFRCLGEPTRLKVLGLLEEGELTVGQLVARIGSSQANISKHLKVLLDAGVLARRVQGTSVYYSIEDPVILKICGVVCDSVEGSLKSRIEGFGYRVPAQSTPSRKKRSDITLSK